MHTNTLTEPEAKRRWCPFARLPGTYNDQPFVANRMSSGAPDGNCLGSGCMAWRWHGVTPTKHVATHSAELRAWMKANPLPTFPIQPRGYREDWRDRSFVPREEMEVFTAYEAERAAWGATEKDASDSFDAACSAHAQSVLAFVATLTAPTDPPDTRDSWEWEAGLDEEDGSPFAGWVTSGGTPLGFCGAAVRP